MLEFEVNSQEEERRQIDGFRCSPSLVALFSVTQLDAFRPSKVFSRVGQKKKICCRAKCVERLYTGFRAENSEFLTEGGSILRPFRRREDLNKNTPHAITVNKLYVSISLSS